MACHFTAALKIPALQSMHERLAANDNDDLDIDTCMDVEASDVDMEGIQSLFIMDFNAGDVIGKIMAFIAQIHACSEDTHDYLQHLAVLHGCPKWQIKLWVCTHWGSLSDCFSVVLVQRKVGFLFYLFFLFFFFWTIVLQAIDVFCVLADDNSDIPPLSHGKKWSNYKLTNPEWRIIKLAYDCLKVCFSLLAPDICVNIQCYDQILAETHGELSVHWTPTIHKVFPLLEKVQSSWEALLENREYQLVNHALEAGLQNMREWYQKTDDTSIYFISHGNDSFSSSTQLCF